MRSALPWIVVGVLLVIIVWGVGGIGKYKQAARDAKVEGDTAVARMERANERAAKWEAVAEEQAVRIEATKEVLDSLRDAREPLPKLIDDALREVYSISLDSVRDGLLLVPD